jgi:murein DD-endopeptidase MepM/ murein hydrolase activator NlpD
MAQKRLTFIIIPPNDGPVQEYKLAPHLPWVGGLALLLFLVAFGYYSLHFHTRIDQTGQIIALTEQNDLLVRSLTRAQEDVDELEERMEVLAMQDQRLRDYHEMEPVRDSSGELGIGGQDEPADLPEDYATMPDFKRKLLSDVAIRIDALRRETLYQHESFAALEDAFLSDRQNLKYIPTIWPVDMTRAWQSSKFGVRTDPFTGRRARHLGVDIAGRRGMDVWATADGLVAYAYEDKNLGKVVVINHNPEIVNEDGTVTYRQGTLRTEYGHLDEILVRKGDRVSRQQVIGKMGSTGRSTGPHVHYAVRFQSRQRKGVFGPYLDPQEYLLDRDRDRDDRAAAYIASSD